ncbi:hypothetical protein NQ314_005561 [Rhamnusium bicolor]|uniref:Uncharacterized protein n=1 Tax=Rhamnusium bicolor TaxID=1586634 RepID=A0AAV8ZJI6_9CUCU|nr:hypothetical protein NQ314_005561 [Rhamnusium bicolor]
MADNLQKRPAKGILKIPAALTNRSHSQTQTEPKTPYNYVDMDNIDGLDANELAEKIRIGAEKPPKAMLVDSDDSDEEELTKEEMQKKKRI